MLQLPSKIDAVQVYRRGATVVRTAQLTVDGAVPDEVELIAIDLGNAQAQCDGFFQAGDLAFSAQSDTMTSVVVLPDGRTLTAQSQSGVMLSDWGNDQSPPGVESPPEP
jgi:hypothetical protein